MGTAHTAHCICGFKTELTVGGTSRAHNATFPFYCDTCGLVSVNTDMVDQGELAKCPVCDGTDVHQYGKAPASIPFVEPPAPGLMTLAANRLSQ